MTCDECYGNHFIMVSDESFPCPSCQGGQVKPPMERAVILETAKQIICGDRARKHGDAHLTMRKIAQYWTIYKGIKFTSADVCMMMVLLKTARQQMNPNEIDNYQDGAGYEALGWEIHAREMGKF